MRLVMSKREAVALVGDDIVNGLKSFGGRKRHFSIMKALEAATKHEEAKDLHSCQLQKLGLCYSVPFYETICLSPTVDASTVLKEFQAECRIFNRTHPKGIGIGELAELFGCSIQTIYDRESKLPPRVKGKWLFADILQYVESKTQTSS